MALQGDVREHVAVLEQVGAAAVQVRRPMDLEGLDALVVPGGESTTMSMLLQSSGLLPALEKLVADGFPMLGTCAGMILLSSKILDGRPDQVCLGAIDLVVRRNAFGRQVESFESELTVRGLDGGPMHAVFIRAPVVEDAGPDVEVLASVALGHGAGDESMRPVVCRQGSVIVAAFHPELAGDRRLHEMLLHHVELEGD
ncbi:MAG: pyridoxal 5'-phosphate synthase glutaminase subunit PdxT [Acidimicrobiales bacterium]|jgi:5'-phosphate synthase pdxT subunit